MKNWLEEEYWEENESPISYGAVWSGIIKGSIFWVAAMVLGIGGLLILGNQPTYYVERVFIGLNMGVFILTGYLAGKAAGYHGGRHGLIAGIAMGIMYVMLLLNSAPLVLNIPLLVSQFLAGLVGGVIGGKLSNILMGSRAKQYSYEVIPVKPRQLDRE